MNYAQAVCDALDDLDGMPFGKINKALDNVSHLAIRSVNDFNELVRASKAALNYIENSESELGITLSSGEMLRDALRSMGESW